MQFKRKPISPPTERELELAADWGRTSRLIEESILLRLNFDPKDIPDPRDRYAPMKWLLNDEYVKYMQVQSNPAAAREYRQQRRTKYAQLLRQLRADLAASYRERVHDIERAGCWRDYGNLVGESLRAKASVMLLQSALILHGLHLPGQKDIAVIACNLVRFPALGTSAHQRVVPIR